MNDLHRCRQCYRFFEHEHPVACHKCQGVFCSVPCKIVHDCEELPDLIAPWDEEHAIDLRLGVNLLHSRLYFAGEIPRRPDGKIICYRCKTGNALWKSIRKGPPVCLSCVREMRSWFLTYLGWPENRGIAFADGYRVGRLSDVGILDTVEARTMLNAVYLLSKFRVADAHLRDRDTDMDLTIMYSDLAHMNIGQPTILNVRSRILEFRPGRYFVVADKGI